MSFVFTLVAKLRYAVRLALTEEMLLQVKWCPAPGCEYAVEFIPGMGAYDLVCKCGFNFCWNVSGPNFTWQLLQHNFVIFQAGRIQMCRF